jgi:hypothetical protein
MLGGLTLIRDSTMYSTNIHLILTMYQSLFCALRTHQNIEHKGWRVAQVVQCLPSKGKSPSSNPNSTKNNNKNRVCILVKGERETEKKRKPILLNHMNVKEKKKAGVTYTLLEELSPAGSRLQWTMIVLGPRPGQDGSPWVHRDLGLNSATEVAQFHPVVALEQPRKDGYLTDKEEKSTLGKGIEV